MKPTTHRSTVYRVLRRCALCLCVGLLGLMTACSSDTPSESLDSDTASGGTTASSAVSRMTGTGENTQDNASSSGEMSGPAAPTLPSKDTSVSLTEATLTPRIVQTYKAEGAPSAPVILTDVRTRAQYNTLADSRPAVAILHLTDTLAVTLDGAPAVSVTEAVEHLAWKILPAFYISSAAQAETLAQYLKVNVLEDCFVVSQDASLVATVRKACPQVQGMLDCAGASLGSAAQRKALRDTANRSMAKTLLLPSSASPEDVAWLQKRLMTVWVRSAGTGTDLYRALTSGANGVETADPAEAYRDLAVFDRTTVFQSAAVVSHRGQPTLHQENTLAGAISAYESGTDSIELDVWLTTDGKLAIIHDGDIAALTTGTGHVESMTLEKFLSYQVDRNPKFAPEPTASLEQFFEYFRGKDVMFTVEMKSGRPAAVTELKRLIESYDMSGQVNIISFNINQLRVCRQELPEISSGYLINKETCTSYEDTAKVRGLVQADSLTCHPDYSRLPSTFGEFTAAMQARGMGLHPWTYARVPLFDRGYVNGLQSLTMEAASVVSGYVTRLETGSTLKLSASKAHNFTATALLKHGTSEVSCEPVVIRGSLTFRAGNGGYIPEGTGSADILLKYSFKTNTGNTVTVYSQPVSVTVS